MPDPDLSPSAPSRVLSSAQTWPTKFLMPVLWLGLMGFVIFRLNLFRLVSPATPILMLAFAFGTASIYWYYVRLKKVTLAGSELIISNYSREIRVPLTSITEVKGSRMSKTRQITVRFDPALGFGGSIVFMPKWRLVFPFAEHPMAQELRDLIERERYLSPRPYAPSSIKPWA